MATIKAYTDIPQSETLSKILPIESADMGWYYSRDPQAARNQMWVGTKAENADVPCWSLAALLGLMPRIENVKPLIYLSPNLDSDEVAIFYFSKNLPDIEKDNLVDACVEMIIRLNELKIL